MSVPVDQTGPPEKSGFGVVRASPEADSWSRLHRHPVTPAADPLQQHDCSFPEASSFGMPVAILIITESRDLAK